MRTTALAASLLALALLALGAAAVHTVPDGAVPAWAISLALALLALPYLAFCLARPAAHRGWVIAAGLLNAGVALCMAVLAAAIPMTGFTLGSKLFLPCLAIAATTGINLVALLRTHPLRGTAPDASEVAAGLRG